MLRWKLVARAVEGYLDCKGEAAMLSRVAQRLYWSVKSGDPLHHDWFEAALETAMNRGVALDQVIWEAVREILDQVEQQVGPSSA